MNILITLIQFILIPVLSPLGVGLMKKIKAVLQNRQGSNIVQPYRDLWKLFHKDEIISNDASWIFKFTPFFVFTTTLLVGISIPIFTTFSQNTITSDMLIVVYILAIGTFFLALSGLDTGSSFGGFGTSREITISSLAEGSLIFSLLIVVLITRTSNLFNISSIIISSYSEYFLPIFLGFFSFFTVLLAETAHYPFDNPSTHLELTMVHEAMILEYSGKRLALIEWASANKLLIFITLGVNLFFPWGIAQNIDIKTLAIGIIVYLAKIIIFYIAIAIIESSISKFRFFKLPNLLIISFILSIIAIGLINL